MHIYIKYIYFLRRYARDCEYEEKIEQKSLDSSVFSMVFLRTEDAGAAVLHVLFFKPVT